MSFYILSVRDLWNLVGTRFPRNKPHNKAVFKCLWECGNILRFFLYGEVWVERCLIFHISLYIYMQWCSTVPTFPQTSTNRITKPFVVWEFFRAKFHNSLIFYKS